MEESTKEGGTNKYSHPSQVPSHGFQVTSQLLTASDFTTSECSGIKTQEEGQGGAAVTTTIKFNSYHGSEPLFGEKTKPKRTSTEARV